VKLMLSIDKQQARNLFREISPSEVKPVPCEDQLLWDVSTYYTTLSLILETTFTPEEIEQKEHVRFLDSYVDRVVSPVQIQPVIGVLTGMKLPVEDLDGLVYTFCKSLRQLPSADRAFWASLRDSLQGVEKLLDLCKGRAIEDELVAAYRTHLVRQLEGEQCSDLYDKETVAKIAEAFNVRIKPRSHRNIPAMSSDEIKPDKIGGSEEGHRYWESAKGADVLGRIKALTFAATESHEAAGSRFTTADRGTLKWQSQAAELLKVMDRWRESDEKSKEDYLHQKSNAYVSLLRLMPQNEFRDEVLRAYVAFLNEFDMDRGSRIEWFWEARYLIAMVMSSPGKGLEILLERIGLTRNQILDAYIEISKLAPKKQGITSNTTTDER
jgi:hypothetical protein